MEPTIQTVEKAKMPAWKKGSGVGAAVFFVLGLIGVVILVMANDEEFGFFEISFQILLATANISLCGFCLGGLVGRFFDSGRMPYWFKFASVATLIPVLFLIIMGAQPGIGMGFLVILVYLALAPIPLFIAGSLLGIIIDKIIWNRKVKKNPEIATVSVQITEKQKGTIKRLFDYFLKP